MRTTEENSNQLKIEYALAYIVLLAAMIFLVFWGYDYFKELYGKMSGGIAANNEVYAIATVVIGFIWASIQIHLLNRQSPCK